MFSYALKRIVRSWKLFAALLLGMTLATTFFGGINIAADTIGKQYIDQQLANNPVDFTLTPSIYQYQYPPNILDTLKTQISRIDGITAVEAQGSASDARNVTLPNIKAIQDNSIVHSHITPTISLSKGQALLASASSQFQVGQKLNYAIMGSRFNANNYTSSTYYYNITIQIVGIATLDTYAQNIIQGYARFVLPSGGPTYYNPLPLIVSWDQTFLPIVQWAYQMRVQPSFSSNVNVFIDRDRLISPWDLAGSANTIKGISDKVSNIALQNGFQENDNITTQIAYQDTALIFLRIPFIIFSIPVFFIAWYVGKTVSQASFNLRRKEIGLLMTKGFSKVQLYRHFVTEALIIGLISGALGLALAFFLNPYFVSVLNGSYNGSIFLTSTTGITTALFALFLTIMAIRAPAQQAASMDPAQALREYIYVEDVAPSKKRGPIVAFGLGLYKIILLILGVNFTNIGRYAFVGGFFTAIVFFILVILDFGLTFFGPFLFLYGAVNLSSGLALKFHKKFSAISKRLIGDFALLASKSIFRNPRRAVSTVFLVAIIAGYSIWVVGDLASMEDFTARQSLTHIGADIRVSGLTSLNNATMLTQRLTSWTNITSATPEVTSQFTAPGRYQIQFQAVDPLSWPSAAYYEDGWFSGNNAQALFTMLASNSQSIILNRGLASYYNIAEDGNLTISSPSGGSINLRVVGFFGPDYSQSSSSIVSPIGGFFQPLGWSYIPLGLVSQYPNLFSGSTQFSVLVKTKGVTADKLATSIQNAYPYTYTQSSITGPNAELGIASIFSGLLNVLRLGTIFAAAVAGIGVGTVAYTGFKEREKETTMIAVRGSSYRQLLGLLVTEVLPLVVFALILASIVGIITVRGDTLALDAVSNQDFYTLLSPRRIAFPLSAQLLLGSIIGLLLLGVFVPAILASRKNLSRVSRTVRFA